MAQSYPIQSASCEADLLYADACLFGLSRVHGLGAKSLNALLKQFSFIQLVCEPEALLEQGLNPALINKLAAINLDSLTTQLAEYRQQSISVISMASPFYPTLLFELPDPPPLLFCHGDVALLEQQQIAIVGSRGASAAGMRHAFNLAADLSRAGMVITSGLAMGIDTQAHVGALNHYGSTIAVLGTGVDVCYPRRNQAVWSQIAEQGLLVSEFLPGTVAKAQHFPRRNRIIAGLSLATVVIEAEQKSGSLITAELAMDYNREVMAMPGAVNNPYSKGCHALIKQGAALIENSTDVLNELGCSLQKGLYINNEEEKKEDNNTLLGHIGYETTTIDEIASRSGLPIAQLVTLLIDLEIEGHIVSTSGGYTRIGGG
ncbi:DNA-processing protein DprA [Pseudoalteromonas sp. SSDWG2]|uniref:DNA-processing protein DprA n=1 Tax=Pseudoalteromonas sp. SSDWG2 TaxID=3139391 RepID=UPI003BA85104